jgi:hypothetical protein
MVEMIERIENVIPKAPFTQAFYKKLASPK